MVSLNPGMVVEFLDLVTIRAAAFGHVEICVITQPCVNEAVYMLMYGRSLQRSLQDDFFILF